MAHGEDEVLDVVVERVGVIFMGNAEVGGGSGLVVRWRKPDLV